MTVMLDDILCSPSVIRVAINQNKEVIQQIAKEYKKREISNVTTVSRGSSHNACNFFKYLLESIAGIMVSKFSPSITTVYQTNVKLGANMTLAVSQSGQSLDTIMVAEAARANGSLTVAITNDPLSPLAKICDYHIFLAAGEEKVVTSTKTYMAELAVLFVLANSLSNNSAKLNINTVSAVLDEFATTHLEIIQKFAYRSTAMDKLIILTRGTMQGIADELSNKLLETTYTFCRPFSTTEFLHGPLAIVDSGAKIMLIAPDSKFKQEFINMATRLSVLGAEITAFTDIKEILDIANDSVEMPTVAPLLTPFLYAYASLIFTYFLAEAKGINPDVPRNLKKVVSTK